MLKGRIPKRWPMMTREDSSILELSIYSEDSSSSGEEDDEQWSEWEDPLWVKDDNLRPRSIRGKQKKGKNTLKRSHMSPTLMLRSMSRPSLSAAKPGQTLASLLEAEDLAGKLPTASTKTLQALLLETSTSFEGQESGVSSASSSASISPLHSPTAEQLAVDDLEGHEEHEEQEEEEQLPSARSVDGDWSFSSREADGGKRMPDPKAVASPSPASNSGKCKPLDEDEQDDDRADHQEDEEEDPWSDHDDDDSEEEKGMEFLLRKYFPAVVVTEEHPAASTAVISASTSAVATSVAEKKKKKKKKSNPDKKKNKKKSNNEKGDNEDDGSGSKKKKKKPKKKDADATDRRNLVFSEDCVRLERRDTARKRYEAFFIPTLDLQARPATADADADVDADVDSPTNASQSSSNDNSGSNRTMTPRKPVGERQRRLPQSAREGFRRKSARELGVIFRCGSREDVPTTADVIVSPGRASPAAQASPSRVRRARSMSGHGTDELHTSSSSSSSTTSSSTAEIGQRPKGKHSWIIRRDDLTPPVAATATTPRKGSRILGRRPAAATTTTTNDASERSPEGRLSVSTSACTTAQAVGAQKRAEQDALSPRKKTGSFRILSRAGAGGRRGSLGDSLTTSSLASSTSSSLLASSCSWALSAPMEAIPVMATTGVPLAAPSLSDTCLASSSSSSSSSSPSSSSSVPAPTMHRGRSSSLNKAAGLFRRSGSSRNNAFNPRAGDAEPLSPGRPGRSGSHPMPDVSGNSSGSGSPDGDDRQRRFEKLMGLKKSWREVVTYFNNSPSSGPQSKPSSSSASTSSTQQQQEH